MIPLYKSLVRPLLEYCSPAWCPFLRQDIVLLEKVQKRFTRMFPGLRSLSYETRLDFLGLMSLEMRRLRADLIEVFRILKGFESVDFDDLFSIRKDSITRGHCYKLFLNRCNLNVRKHFFTERIVSSWNNLPHEAVHCTSVNSFKSHLTSNLLKNLMGDYKSRKEDSLPRQPSLPRV